MNNLVFIEDIFLAFFDSVDYTHFTFQKQDRSAAISFYNTLLSGNKITQNQANYILRILEKYKNIAAMSGLDYVDQLADPKWKNEFRVIDMSRKAWVEQSDNGSYWICLKFPFSIKNDFDKEFGDNNADIFSFNSDNVWDKDRRVRMLSLYDFNIIKVYEFCKEYNFTFEESFYDTLASVEDIWNSYDSIVKKSVIEDNQVKLVNADDDTIAFFNKHSTDCIDNNALLAKSMGYVLASQPANKAQKIAGTKNTQFYTRDYKDLFEVTEKIDGKIAILLDRSADTLEWLKSLSTYIDSANLLRDNFKVCFRESNKEHPEFNQWVKDNGFGGKVSEGKYLIFQHKPAKWLFSDNVDVKMLITNNVYPSTSGLTKQWLNTHPCVVYLADIKNSSWSKDIVEL
jgi:hypothetical protein